MSGCDRYSGAWSTAQIVELMSDLGEALHSNPDTLFLGGGNPAHIPEFEAIVSEQMQLIASDPKLLHSMVGIYQSPQGSEELIAELVAYFRAQGWSLGPENICITNGSQSAFAILFEMLCKPSPERPSPKIALPLVPEYLGYADQLDSLDAFECFRPLIETIGDHEFRYHIDFERLSLSSDVAALCISRPTNPSGNVLGAEEVQRLGEIADFRGIPLIIDCAYGSPFPGIEFNGEPIRWQENRVFAFSLSKLGLPGVRTGIVVGDADLIQAMSQANTVKSLASGSFGPALFTQMLRQYSLDSITQEMLKPHYAEKREVILGLIKDRFAGLPYRVHAADGAFFVWLWFEGLPISSAELYQKLKAKGVLVVDGESFFYGNFSDWSHTRECIRLSYCSDVSVLEQAIGIIADQLSHLFRAG